MKFLYPIIIALFISNVSFSQRYQIKGKLIDISDKTPQVGVVVSLINTSDTLNRSAMVSDTSGSFIFINIKPGNYFLQTDLIGYKTMRKPLIVNNSNIDLSVLLLETDTKMLKEVKVEGLEVRSKQKGDTTEFNARAFKVNPDANVQDLITKMPGVTVEGGTVKAQGEEVKKILVDGKEFFGNDISMALKNIPADAIDKVQVFDRVNEQSRLSGFNDGNTEKSINITTKPGMSNGQFGRVYAGYGTDDRFSLGGNYNSFDKKRRISLVGQSNNINQQNFSSQDLAGISSGGSGGGSPRGGMGGGPGRGGPGGGGPANNFMVGQQGGINTTHAYGINYSDSWGKKINVTGSYFFNRTGNATAGIVKRFYYLPNGTNQYFNQDNIGASTNDNHRFNARLEYNPDTNNSITITPQVSFQKNYSESRTIGKTTLTNESLLNSTNNTFQANTKAFNLSNNLLYNHKFVKRGRTYSVNLGTSLNTRDADNALRAANVFYRLLTDSTQLIDQQAISTTKGYNLNTNISYSEPLGKNGSLQISYNPSWNKNNSEQLTRKFETLTQAYSRLDTNLSNKFLNNIITHSAGLTYRYKAKKYNFNIGANYQTVHLYSEATFPKVLTVNKYFENLLPTAMYQYTFDNKASLRLFYRTNTNAPSVTQLQNVINNTNPLSLVAGNPNLVQEYAHFLMMRYNISNVEKGKSFFIFMGGGATVNYIANSSMIAQKDTLLNQGILLNRGSQLSKPVNVDGFWNFRSFTTYSMPIKFLKSNLNLNSGFNYTTTPGMINETLNKVDNYNINGNIGLGSNISQKIDFNISYSPNYSIIKNTIQPKLNNNYYFATASIRANWLPWKGLVLSTDVNNTIYTGLGAEFNQNFWLWNAGLGYKFMKSRMAEIRLTVFDLLDQNNSAGRMVTETYTEDNRTQVLRRYFMLTLTYNIKKFAGAKLEGTAAPKP